MKAAASTWKKRSRWTDSEAEAALAAASASGLSLRRFATLEGLVPERFYRARRRLGAAKARGATRPTEFIEIATTTTHRTVEVVFPSGVVVRVAETIDPSVLRRLVDALDPRGC